MKIKPYLLAAASGLLLFIVFPNKLGIQLWPLAWVCLVPMFYAAMGADTARRAGKIAAVAGLAGYPLFYHWLVYCMNTFASMPYYVTIPLLFALAATLSLYLFGFGYVSHVLRSRLPINPALALALAWVTFEYVRGHFPFGGFPWALMAYSQEKFLPMIQVAEFTGPYGVSFVLVLTNAALALALRVLIAGRKSGDDPGGAKTPGGWKRALAVALAAAIVPPVLCAGYGLVRMPMVDRAFSERHEVGVGIVQANIPQDLKWEEEFFLWSMEEHIKLSRKVMAHEPRLVMWPEAAVTARGGFLYHWRRRSEVIMMLSQVNAHLLTGAMIARDCGKERLCWYNSAVLLSPGAQSLEGTYAKMHLVPFSEYVPMSRLLFFADAIAQGNAGSTTAGKEVQLLAVPEGRFGCVICYEVIFPELVRRFVDEGAVFMTTITNDAWFGKSGAPYQHHSNVVFRSIENRVYFLRSANTGISSCVDPNGRIVHQTDIYVPAAFNTTIKTSPIRTFYTAFGDVFVWVVVGVTALSLALAFFRGRKKGPGALLETTPESDPSPEE